MADAGAAIDAVRAAARGAATQRPGRTAQRAVRGFTLIELLVVVVIVALGAGVVSLALRDATAGRLQREGERLATLLEAARAEARAGSLSVRWVPATTSDEDAFRFVGLPASVKLPTRWIEDGVTAQVVGNPFIVLGPDAIIGPQRILLRLDDRRLELATDGIGPFVVVDAA